MNALLPATRSELTKQFTTSMWWILAIVLVAYVGSTAGGLAFVFGASATGLIGPEQGPPIPEAGLAPLIYSLATAIGYVFPLLIGTLMVTAEFRHKTLTPTFLATPERWLVLVAKLLVGVAIGALFGLLAILATVIPGAAILAALGVETELGSSDTWALVGRMLLVCVLWTLIGIGAGALVRNQVAAIVAVLAFTQFVEPLLRVAATFVDGLADIARFLPGAASDALAGQGIFSVGVAGGATADALPWWAGGLVLLAYAVGFVALGHLVSWRRDVT